MVGLQVLDRGHTEGNTLKRGEGKERGEGRRRGEVGTNSTGDERKKYKGDLCSTYKLKLKVTFVESQIDGL